MTQMMLDGAQNGAVAAGVGGGGGGGAPFAPCPPVSPGGHGGFMGGQARSGAPGVARVVARNGAHDGAPDGAVDAAFVIARLEEAGETLMALPASGPSTRMRTASLDIVRSALEGYGWASANGSAGGRLRPSAPSPAAITRMDQTLAWLGLIPDGKYVIRRIVSSRSLKNPATGRHLYPWRRLGTLLGADHKAIQRWHAQGIDILVAALNRR